MPYQVFSITRSPLAVGLIALFELVPVLGLGLVGGAIADAVDRRRLLLWANLALAASGVLLVLNARPGFHNLWAIYAIASMQAVFATLVGPALESAIPRIVPKQMLFGVRSDRFRGHVRVPRRAAPRGHHHREVRPIHRVRG
jgi:MFS family permease